MHVVWLILEGIVKYVFLGLVVTMVMLFILMILLFERDRVRGILRLPILEEKFDDLCDFSDRLDEPYTRTDPFACGLWVRDLIIKCAIGSVGLIIIWIILSALKG